VQRDGGSHKKDEAPTPEVTPSPPKVPEVSKPTNAPDQEDISSNASDGVTDQNYESDDEESDLADPYTLEELAYDKADGVYRCVDANCGWEIAFGYCHGCRTRYMVEVRP
jgi:hypothetical protein